MLATEETFKMLKFVPTFPWNAKDVKDVNVFWPIWRGFDTQKGINFNFFNMSPDLSRFFPKMCGKQGQCKGMIGSTKSNKFDISPVFENFSDRMCLKQEKC